MSRQLRLLGNTGIVALLALFMILPVAGAAPYSAETRNVTIRNFAFDPQNVTVNVGDTVMWRNEGPSPHTATAADQTFDSGNLNTGQEFSFTFTTAGSFNYICQYHESMVGTITVQEAAAQPTAAPEQPTAAPEQPTTAPAQPTTAPAGEAPSGSIEVSDQPINNGSIQVANVTAGQDGWIVAHLDEGGKPGRVIGHTAVTRGSNNNVMIRLSEEVPAGGRLWPMLHIDAGTIGTYEFPGPDSPVIVNSNVVMKQITITSASTAGGGAGGAPAGLPRTSGEDLPAKLVLAALALVVAGVTLALRARRRSA